jgi:hypothetical protein
MNNQESGNEFVANEASKMELKNGIGNYLENLRTTNYSDDELRAKRDNMSGLEEATR